MEGALLGSTHYQIQTECLASELVGNWVQLHRAPHLVVLVEHKQIAPMAA